MRVVLYAIALFGPVLANIIIYYAGVIGTLEKRGMSTRDLLLGTGYFKGVARYLRLCRNEQRTPVWLIVIVGNAILFLVLCATLLL